MHGADDVVLHDLNRLFQRDIGRRGDSQGHGTLVVHAANAFQAVGEINGGDVGQGDRIARPRGNADGLEIPQGVVGAHGGIEVQVHLVAFVVIVVHVGAVAQHPGTVTDVLHVDAKLRGALPVGPDDDLRLADFDARLGFGPRSGQCSQDLEEGRLRNVGQNLHVGADDVDVDGPRPHDVAAENGHLQGEGNGTRHVAHEALQGGRHVGQVGRGSWGA